MIHLIAKFGDVVGIPAVHGQLAWTRTLVAGSLFCDL